MTTEAPRRCKECVHAKVFRDPQGLGVRVKCAKTWWAMPSVNLESIDRFPDGTPVNKHTGKHYAVDCPDYEKD